MTACEDGNGNKRAPEAAHHEVAQYIAAMAVELACLAESHNLDTLAYILDMARLEAEQVAEHCDADLAHESVCAR